MQCCIQCTGASAWFHNYDDLQTGAIVLLYLQVACSLIGSLGAFYTGVLVANLALALFGLVAIASGSQTLGRTYAALLACTLLVDIAWFILFSVEIRRDPSYRELSVFSVWIVFSMQVASSALRLLSSLFWVQMYRLGAQTDTSAMYQPVDFEGRISTFELPNDRPSPSHAVSMSEEILGGSIYNPATFSTVFQFTDEPYFGTEAHNQVRKEAFNGPNLNADSQSSNSLLEKT
ncbi:unnamed protein product [Calypogeia fissa]